MPQEIFEKIPVITQIGESENTVVSVLTQREQVVNEDNILADIYTDNEFTSLIQEKPNTFNHVNFLEGELLMFFNANNIDVEIDINGNLIIKNNSNYIINDMGELIYVK